MSQDRNTLRFLDRLKIVLGGAMFGTCVQGALGLGAKNAWEGAAIGAGIMAVLIGTRVIRVTG